MIYPSFSTSEFQQLFLACAVFQGDFARVRKTFAFRWCDGTYNAGPIDIHRLFVLSLDFHIASLSLPLPSSAILVPQGPVCATGMEDAEMESFPSILLFPLRYRNLLHLSISNPQLP